MSGASRSSCDLARFGWQAIAAAVAKRWFDILVSALLLMACAPLLATVAGLVRWRLGHPVLFRQERPGFRGKPFLLLKFRTMTEACDGQGRLLEDGQRLTRLGAFLRRSSLDELPELWNVLKGDMSLVGPRPLLTEYLPVYTPTEARRHLVKPGITGWAQINGRNLTAWPERLAMDVWYVDHQSFSLDLQILWRTLGKVATREGAAANPDLVETNLREERCRAELEPF